MPNPNGINQVKAPVDIAAEMYTQQMNMAVGQILGPERRTRFQRMGDLPAEPILEAVTRMVPKE
jgi:translation initiation factor 2 alpha subunit (eIF-2alpha)